MSRRTGSALCALAGLLALAAAPARAAAPPRIDAAADRRELAQDEVLWLTVRVEAEAMPSRLDPPAKDFDFSIVDRSQSQQTSMTFTGGAVQARYAVEWGLGLAPRRAGQLTVPPFTVTVGGARYDTAPIAVKVLPAGSRPRPPSPPPPAPAPAPAPGPTGGTWRGWERDLWLEVQVDRKSPWLGEQVTASVYLVSPVGLLGIEGFKPPAYDGFWAETLELPQRLEPRRRVVGGIPLNAFLVQRIALFPTRAGKLTIEPFQADVNVQVLSGNRLFDPFRRVEQVRRRSAPVTLDVRPLPAGAPAGFESVNVGSLTLELAASERTVPAGEPIAIRLTARGEGNARAWSLPRLPPIAGTRRFDPTASDDVKAPRGRVAGGRTLETLLVPARAGELVIPPLAWPWFDVKAGRYQVARTAELRIPVTGGAGADGLPAAPPAPLALELRPIRSGDALERASDPPWRRPLFALLLALAPAGFAGVRLSERLRERSRLGAPGRRVRGALRAARRRLAAAERRLRAGDAAGGVAEVERALTGYAADKVGRPVGGLTREALGATLAGAGAPPPAVRALLAALDACDAARFGGAAPGEPLLDAAARAMALLGEGDGATGAGGTP